MITRETTPIPPRIFNKSGFADTSSDTVFTILDPVNQQFTTHGQKPCNRLKRWYEPTTGKWHSNDPIGIPGGLNQYVFCGDNPVNCTDPLGLWNFWSPASWGVANGIGWSVSDSLNPLHESAGWSGYGWGASEGAAAALDGIIPFWDPFEIAYTDECGNFKDGTYWSRELGAFSRDVYIMTLGLRGAGWRVDPPHHGLGPHDHFRWGRGMGLRVPNWGSRGARWNGWLDWMRRGGGWRWPWN